TLTAIAREAPLGRVALQGLAMSETAALIAAREQASAVGPGELETLQARTDGNPFFLEALLDAGLTRVGTAMPVDVAELVVSRVEALGPSVKRVLEVAAILGREFDPVLAAAVARIETNDAMAALDRAAEAHLVSALT